MSVDRKTQILDNLDKIKHEFYDLQTQLVFDNPKADLSFTIPSQKGLRFPINIDLMGDKLSVNVGNSLEWSKSSCEKQEVQESFFNMVYGLIMGKCQIVEHYSGPLVKGKKAIKAELQERKGKDLEWETVFTWSRFHIPLPWTKTTRNILRNS